jgi:hypothetical protein
LEITFQDFHLVVAPFLCPYLGSPSSTSVAVFSVAGWLAFLGASSAVIAMEKSQNCWLDSIIKECLRIAVGVLANSSQPKIRQMDQKTYF